jgi:glycosyltransferase involved in cell wall biosynthesis
MDRPRALDQSRPSADPRLLTVVIPVFNERDNIPIVFDELNAVLDELHGWRAEVIWIDDGSTDGSSELLTTLPSRDARHGVIKFRRNFGQTAALVAGFEHAEGSVVITLDGDLQNDPRDIGQLLAKIDEGYDIVNGWRKDRRDTYVTRIVPSRIANWLISRVTGVRLHDYGCTLKAYKADVARNLSLHGDLHRFIPALASWYGVEVAEVAVNHRPRVHGSSKYGMGRTIRVLIDLMTVKFFLGYSGRPGHFFGVAGLALSSVGTALLVYLGIDRLFFGVALSDRPVLLLAILLVVAGLQFIATGLVAEMILRSSRGGPVQRTYAIRELIGVERRADSRDAFGESGVASLERLLPDERRWRVQNEPESRGG